MAIIKAPVETFNGALGGVQFANGKAETDNEGVIAYCKAAGYTVEESSGGEPLTRPSKSAAKGAWEAYATQEGHSVDGLTKDELVALFPDEPGDGDKTGEGEQPPADPAE